MRILGIDTTTKFLCLGIYDNGKIYECNIETARSLSSLLVPTIKRTLDVLGWTLKDIDYFACGLGPGSFTGVRVGLSTIKGFAWALNKPILGISTLDILARNVKISDGYVMPVIDAKRGLIYSSIYKFKSGILKRIGPYMLLTLQDLTKFARPNSIIFGDALGLYADIILRNIKGASILDKDYWNPMAHNIVWLALERIREKRFSSSFDIKPIYLYPKECQIKKT